MKRIFTDFEESFLVCWLAWFISPWIMGWFICDKVARLCDQISENLQDDDPEDVAPTLPQPPEGEDGIYVSSSLLDLRYRKN